VKAYFSASSTDPLQYVCSLSTRAFLRRLMIEMSLRLAIEYTEESLRPRYFAVVLAYTVAFLSVSIM